MTAAIKSYQKSFQLTPSQRATIQIRNLPKHENHFNSRPHRGRHVSGMSEISGLCNFNSRPHRGRPNRRNHICKLRHFNSRPHRGRQCLRLFLPFSYAFQLTPSQRATNRLKFNVFLNRNFNSRPHRGRLILCWMVSVLSHFNSRPHRGRPMRLR